MTVASAANGTQTATISVEHTLASPAGPATYVLVVDTTNLVNGDVLELRCKSKTKAGGSQIQDSCDSFAHVQANPQKKSIPILAVYGATFTLKQTAGTGRAFDWDINQL